MNNPYAQADMEALYRSWASQVRDVSRDPGFMFNTAQSLRNAYGPLPTSDPPHWIGSLPDDVQ